MTDESRALGPVALDAALLDAKQSIAGFRPGSVSRAGLIAAARASDCRVVGVTAPAGYGKSTFLAEWAVAEDRPVAWASLDRFDDDPIVLLSLLARAFSLAVPGSPNVVADMSGTGVSVLGRAAPRLASAFRAAPSPFVMMVDDLHEVQTPECHDALSVVIAGIPPGSQFVAASRADQTHLPRLRASGDALEFGMGDLALDASGAAQIFSNAMVSLAPEAAALVTERTEGWPVGLYLASLAARDGDEASQISGEDRYVADYLYRESLLQLDEEDQCFLRWTSVLDHLSAPLCDAVLGGSGAQMRLRRLEAASHFLVPLDRRREWFRYHALFREFLLGELRRVEPDVIPKLHLRAADWYEASGSSAKALEHLLNTAERERCAHVLSTLVLATHTAGQNATVVRWLAAVGDDAIEQYPPLAVLAGWVFALTGRTAEAQRWAAFTDVAAFEPTPLDGTASFASSRAMLRSFMCAAGPEQAVADANVAVAAEPEWSVWRDQAFGIAGEAYLLLGDVQQAQASFEAAIAAGSADSDAYVVSKAELALLAMDRGQWDEAAEHLRVTLEFIDEHRMQDYVTSVLAFAGSARFAMHRGDLPGTQRELTRAMRARASSSIASPGIAVRLRLQLAKVYWALGDLTTVRHLQRELDDLLHERPDLGVLVDEVEELRRSTSAARSGPGGASPLSPAELRLLPYLQTHLMMREIAERLFVSRNTVSSQVSSIYRKLGVSSRHEAVDQATAMGLLGA